MKTETLHIFDMTCSGCAQSIEQGLAAVPGVQSAEVSFGTSTACVEAEDAVSAGTLLDAVTAKGYRAERKENALLSSRQGSSARHLAVIGAGSAAFAAAIEAAREGARVTIVEAGTLGGTCVNIGCVPSKFLIRAAHVAHNQTQQPYAGLPNHEAQIDRRALLKQQTDLVASLRQQKYEQVIESNPFISVVQGFARMTGAHTVAVALTEGGEQEIKADRILIATGSIPVIPDVPGLKDTPYWDSTSALFSEELPEHLIVAGAGYVALELAQLFLRLGSRVTLLARSTLLSKEDPAIGAALKGYLEAEGMQVITNAALNGVRHDGANFTVDTGRETLVGDRLLIAAGRRPNTAGLNAERAGVKVDERGAIVIDAEMRTTVPHIFAAGDCTSQPEFVYVAAAAGGRAAGNMFGGNRSIDFSTVPAVMFTDPSVATVGMSEQEAARHGIDTESRTLTLDNVARALVNLDTRGFIKIVADKKTLRVLGVQIVAAEAGEIIETAAMIIRNKMTVSDITAMLFPYLTMVEGLRLCALSFFMDVKEMSCCAG